VVKVDETTQNGRVKPQSSCEENEGWPLTLPLVAPLHRAALANGCSFRVDETENGRTIVYSVRNLRIKLDDGRVSLTGAYDIRAFLKLYRGTDDDITRKLLFDAATPCCYCIDDKCTTLLMADQRTIRYEDQAKKLCGPYRHTLRIDVNSDNASACVAIVNMMLEHTYPYMHRNLTVVPNEVTYKLAETDEFFVLGYSQKHSPISPSDEEFAASLLRKDETGRRKIDTLLEAAHLTHVRRYVGAVDDFVSGVSYSFLFGIMVGTRPDILPEGAVCRKVRGGQWAVYNSSAGCYRSVWRHFTERFYEVEHQGYDSSRIPFEYYDQDGCFSDVHIPVDSDMPADSGITWQVTHTPNELLAGYGNYAETDYPLYTDRPFDEPKRIGELFPHAQCLTRVSIHALFGKPLFCFEGVAVDDLSAIPEGVELYHMQGGYWRRLGWKHFNGGYQGWGEAFDARADSALPVWDMHHPRGFNEYVYNARGGYSEIGVPMRLVGKRRFELVELPPQRVIGKLEAPPESVVTQADQERFYDMPENAEEGTYVIGFTQVLIQSPVADNLWAYFDKPLVQGVLAKPNASAPDGLSEFTLDSGLYVKVTEGIPNGVLGWELGRIENVEKETGRAHDQTRQFVYKQCAYGKSYELYVPVI
jgi:hypothetical protein